MVTIPQVTIHKLYIEDDDYIPQGTIDKLDIEGGDYTSRNHR